MDFNKEKILFKVQTTFRKANKQNKSFAILLNFKL